MRYCYEHVNEGKPYFDPVCFTEQTAKGRFLVDQKFGSNALIHCPHCHSQVRRVIENGVGVFFKGSGWSRKDIKMELEVEKRIDEGDTPKPWDYASTGYYPGPGEGFIEPGAEFARQIGSGEYHDKRGEKL